MSIKEDIKQLFKPYFIFNILLSLSYVILKRLPGACNYLFNVEDCEFDGRETEILFFLIIVVMIRTRKAGSVSMINYLSSSFLYTKAANLILWLNADFLMGIIFGIVFILGALLFPEPTYSGPDNVTYFRGLQGLEDELSRVKDSTYWLITFYTAWNPICVNFAPNFAKLSNEYNLHNLRFGKVDVGRYPEAAKKYQINDGSLSKQLPTTILFKDGKEVHRRPIIDSKGVQKFVFTADHVRGAFDLNNLFDECKTALKGKKTHIKNE